MKIRIPNNLDDFINESVKSANFETSNIEDFLDFIDDIPDNIGSINVPTEMAFFNPNSVRVKGSDKNWKNTVKDIIKKAYKESKSSSYGIIELFTFNSYGLSKAFRPGEKYYIQYNNEKSMNFGKEMGSGKHGSLD